MQDAVVVDPHLERVRAVYEGVHARLWRSVLAHGGCAEVADDAVAEAFVQLLRRGAAVRDPEAWVWRSAFRIAGGELQRRRALGSQLAIPDVGVEAEEPVVDLVRTLAGLSDQQRACVVLCDLAGHPAPAAARILGTTAATVRVQLMRARRRLRDLLEDDDG